jgi:hydroxymethylbilane synthase
MSDEGLHLRALIATPDGSACLRTARTGAARDAELLGQDAGEELTARAGAGFFD